MSSVVLSPEESADGYALLLGIRHQPFRVWTHTNVVLDPVDCRHNSVCILSKAFEARHTKVGHAQCTRLVRLQNCSDRASYCALLYAAEDSAAQGGGKCMSKDRTYFELKFIKIFQCRRNTIRAATRPTDALKSGIRGTLVVTKTFERGIEVALEGSGDATLLSYCTVVSDLIIAVRYDKYVCVCASVRAGKRAFVCACV